MGTQRDDQSEKGRRAFNFSMEDIVKKLIMITLVVLALASLSQAQMPEQRFELNLFGGYALTSVKGAATYGDSWNYYLLNNVSESAAIATTSKNAPFFGGGFNYFFTPNFGVGLNVGYLKSTLNTTSAFDFSWTWSSLVGGGTYSQTADWASNADSLTSIPVSLNLVGRFGDGPIQGFFEAGPTVYFNEAIINTAIGYGVTQVYGSTQYVDAVELPMVGFDSKSGKSSWTGIGANVGGGITFMFSPSFGLSLEARYFFCPEREFDWAIATGSYNGMFFGDLTNWTMTAADIQPIFDNNLLTTIKINPSFFALQGGLKIKI
jgi:Outer membrane protein beta-barrel domain